MTGNEVRKAFLDYFAKQQHRVLPSSPLVPQKDPSLLFTNAGMVQFKSVFLGEQDIGTRRATTSQKCLRVSGKHNDFENVGRTARHHTFFEMLGNFSFGDYFKPDAIRFAWELLTQVYKLDPNKLYASVFETDDEAAEIWRTRIGVPPERIVRFGEKENFWSMGDTGPCGPCSEIIYDQGPDFEGTIDGEGDRFLELWNLVFMQYNRDETGKLTPLPRPSIDTGAGLERITAVLQGCKTNYDSDLFTAIHRETTRLSGHEYLADPDTTVSMRVVADHIRAIVFLIADGVLPSNEGRGYVLRRIMRRAARHGVLLGLKDPFLYQVGGAVISTMKGAYPELQDRASYIAKVVKNEEERFLRTLETGLKMLNAELARAQGVLDGALAFKLYDTYGFPLDLTEDICRDRGVTVDKASFDQAMERQRNQSRAAWEGSGAAALSAGQRELLGKGFTTEFVGYDNLKAEAEIIGLLRDGTAVDRLAAGESGELYADLTPFYAEMGGQLGDQGKVLSGDALADVTDARHVGGLVAHLVRVRKGEVAVGRRVTLAIDPVRRQRIQRNHTATHLLHKALHEVLGPDAKQAGSLVAPERLRFDFTHYAAMKQEELLAVETRVNEMIMADEPVSATQRDYDAAVKAGAMALFGEKYDKTVRVIEIGAGESLELCGGTHLQRTGQIGSFVIVAEGSVAAGVRRIEALTGDAAVAHFQTLDERLRTAAELLKAAPAELVERTEKLLAQYKAAEKEIEKLKAQLAGQAGQGILEKVQEIGGVKVLADIIALEDPKELRNFAATLRDKLGSGVLFLAANAGGKALLIAMVTPDLTNRFHAGKIIQPAAQAVGGGGGGKPDMAQAGGSDAGKLDEALAAALAAIRAM